jgi:hypothetical protein
MIRKPWPIIIVSFIFFFIPILNIVGTYLFMKGDFHFSDYIHSLLFDSTNYLPLFNMIVPSVLAGYAIYSVKKWSYPVFLACMLWITCHMLSKFSSHTFSELLFSAIIPMIINIVYVSYLLLPKMRAPFYDARLRWWETKPRYVYSTDVQVSFNNNTSEGQMTNISEGGLFAIIPMAIEPQTTLNLKFSILATPIELKAKIVYRKPDGTSHGLQFCDLNKSQKKTLKQMMARLAQEKYEVTRPVPRWSDDFIKWFKTLMTTGKGLVPETPPTYQPPKKD